MNLHGDIDNIKAQLSDQLDTQVKIALFGRGGVGKSSIINALIGQNLAKVSARTDTTRDVEMYNWNNLILTDLPGYSTRSYPAESFIEKFRLLEYDIILCVFDGKITEDDEALWKALQTQGKSCIFVRNKSRDLDEEERAEIQEDLSERIEGPFQLFFVNARKELLGFNVLEEAIAALLDSQKREKWYSAAKAYSKDFLEKKLEAAKSRVTKWAGIAAINGLNPVIGLDIAVDVVIIQKMMTDISDCFGLTEEVLENVQKKFSPQQLAVIQLVLRKGSPHIIAKFLTRFAGKQLGVRAAKFFPIVGQVVAGTAGFALTKAAGNDFAAKCYELAMSIVEEDLTEEKGG